MPRHPLPKAATSKKIGETKSNTRSLFHGETKSHAGESTPVSTVFSASTPQRVPPSSNPSSPALYSAIHEYGAGLSVVTRGTSEDGLPAPTPLITGLLVDVDMGLGAADKPKVWTPAKILSINPTGDVTVEFDDGNTMNGIRQERVRIKGGFTATPSTALLERRMQSSQNNTSSTPAQESKGIHTPNTLTLEAMNQTQSTIASSRSLSRGNSYRSMTDSVAQKNMLDDTAVLEALHNSDLATAAMSPGKPTPNTDDSFSLAGTQFEDDENKQSSANILVPALDLSKTQETKDSGYISPPSSSPVKGRESLQKITERVIEMKTKRGGLNTAAYVSGFLSAREFESASRMRSLIGMLIDGVGKVGRIGDVSDKTRWAVTCREATS